MKRISLILLAALLFAACQKEKATVAPPTYLRATLLLQQHQI
jgi:PBP1b-binding outer membrane lipoprotein LpoB